MYIPKNVAQKRSFFVQFLSVYIRLNKHTLCVIQLYDNEVLMIDMNCGCYYVISKGKVFIEISIAS